MLQAQRKAFYSDELLDMITSTEELRGLTQTNFWERFALRMTSIIQQIIEFAKLTPGFDNLSQDDQIMVLKGGKQAVMFSIATECGRGLHCRWPIRGVLLQSVLLGNWGPLKHVFFLEFHSMFSCFIRFYKNSVLTVFICHEHVLIDKDQHGARQG